MRVPSRLFDHDDGRDRHPQRHNIYVIHDPAVVVKSLLKLQEISEEHLRDINELRENIGHDPVEIEEDEES